MALNLQHQTAAQFMVRIRKRWDELSKVEKARLAAWLYNRFNSGDITQAQIRTAFNLTTTAEWNAFRDKILALRDNYNAVMGAE